MRRKKITRLKYRNYNKVKYLKCLLSFIVKILKPKRSYLLENKCNLIKTLYERVSTKV